MRKFSSMYTENTGDGARDASSGRQNTGGGASTAFTSGGRVGGAVSGAASGVDKRARGASGRPAERPPPAEGRDSPVRHAT